jgi:translocation and assembly module TamB
MPEEEVKASSEPAPEEPKRARRRSAAIFGLVAIAVIVVLILSSLIFYRVGGLDRFIKSEFTAAMADIGLVFEAEVFRVTVNPLELELGNATFYDKVSGEKLFFIREAHFAMTMLDVFALRLRRDIQIDKTDIVGAEVWVTFDEQGKSNFSNLTLAETDEEGTVTLKYKSVDFSLRESVVHFDDMSRDISGNGRNLVFLLSPENSDVPDEEKRYKFDLTSTDSNFVYHTSNLENIDLRAVGIVDRNGAEITTFELITPISETYMTGTITNWESPTYHFDIRTTVDLTQATSIFQTETAVTGVGNFTGTVSGQGETYTIEGEADSESLQLDGVYLKAVNLNGTVNGTNTTYDANGTAVAEMLTFEDFRVDFLKMVGNVRGTGTDFRWLGELEAAAASSPYLTIGGLYLADAVAEHKDREIRGEAGNARAQRFAIGDTEFEELQARDMRFTNAGGGIDLSSPSAQARSFRQSDIYRLNTLTGQNVRVTNKNERTDVSVDNLRSETAELKGSKITDVTTDHFLFTNLPSETTFTAKNLRADEINVDGTLINGLESPVVELRDSGGETVIYSDENRIAGIDAGGAILGSMNIGGVRLTIRDGWVQARSNDIDAGDVILTQTETLPAGGNLNAVKIAKPVYVLEPSGRYRATADMSIGGGAIGSVALGAASAKVDVNNDRVALNELTANIMDGQLNGRAVVALNEQTRSSIAGTFTNLDIAQVLALQTGEMAPIEGDASGTVDMTFDYSDTRAATGTLNANITASGGTGGTIPVNGKVDVSAANGLFTIQTANLRSPSSVVTAGGQFDLVNENSDLTVAVRSTDASEVDRLMRGLAISPEYDAQADAMEVQLAGNVTFDATLKGNLYDPVLDGHLAVESVSMHGTELGSVSTDIKTSPAGIEFTEGKLVERDGGTAAFTVTIPYGGANNTSLKAILVNINAASVLAALDVDLPGQINDLDGQMSGTVNITGLPDAAQGDINLSVASGTIAGQSFDNLVVDVDVDGTTVKLERAEIHIGAGNLSATGTYDRASGVFNVDITGKAVPAPVALAILPKNDNVSNVTGNVDFTAHANGVTTDPSSYNVNFNGVAHDVKVGEYPFGEVVFKGETVDQVLTVNVVAVLEGKPQVIHASLDLGDEDLPLTATITFDQSPLAPFLSFIPQLTGVPITGMGTGRVEVTGNLSHVGPGGDRIFSGEDLTGKAEFSQLTLQIEDTTLNAAGPVLITFNTSEINFEQARFTGGGSNMTIAGTKALVDGGMNNLSIDGRVNLSLLNVFVDDVFFSGFADTSIKLIGPEPTARVIGTANVLNGSIATFVGANRFSADRIKAKLTFTTNQVEISEATGYLGGGEFTAEGGAVIDGLEVQAYRLSVNGENVTVPIPQDFVTTGDAQLELTGRREAPGKEMETRMRGQIFARRSIYTKDIDLTNVVGSRRDPVLSGSSGTTKLLFEDLVITGRDALVVRNNIADLTASVSLVLSGDANDPRLTGRIIANSGTIFFRKDRYVIQRGVLEFPPNSAIEPIINLQAETEIGGYQIFVNLSGALTDTELLTANVRSSPALPQADVVSLITTGTLSDSAGGIGGLAQTGVNTAAEILADSIVNNPVRKVTDKLFGLNVFEIDPIIYGQQGTPGARLTVGRQINSNLRVTYATNLSQDQQQVLALEYRVSNKLSFVAQYEQRRLANVTRNRDNFSFEIRFRKRF